MRLLDRFPSLGRRAGATVTVAAFMLILGAAAASAYWGTLGTGTGTAQVATLTATSAPAGTTHNGTVTLTWTAASGGSGNFTYAVERAPRDTTTWTAACSEMPTANLTCTDTPGTANTYDYRVVAITDTWTKRSATASIDVGVKTTSLRVATAATTVAGAPLTVTVTALDSLGQTATNFTGIIRFTSTDSEAVLPENYMFVPADAGVRQFTAALATAGTHTITAASVSTAGITGVTSPITVTASALSALTVTAPTTATAGVAVTATVTATDTFGNPAAGWTSATGCVTITGPIASPNGTAPLYPARSTCAAGQSLLTFNPGGQATAQVTLYRAETTTLRMTAATRTGTSAPITVSSNLSAAKTLAAAAGGTQSTLVGTPFAATLQASVVEMYGNPVPGVPVTFTAPASGASAMFAGGCTSNPSARECVDITNAAGIAKSSVFTANNTVGRYAATATATGMTAVSYTTITNTGKLHISSLTTNGSTGSGSWSGIVQVAVRDSLNNPVSGVVVTGAWNPTAATTKSCTTNAVGTCIITPAAGTFPGTQQTETWKLTDLAATYYTYEPASNTASSVTVARGCTTAAVCFTNQGTQFQATFNASTTPATLNTGTVGTIPNGATVLILVSRDGNQTGDAISQMNVTGITTPTLVKSMTTNLSSRAGSFTNMWTYRATGTGGTPTISVVFNKADNLSTLVQVLIVAGENTASPGMNSGSATGTGSAATAPLTGASASNGQVVLTAQASSTNSTTSSSTVGMNLVTYQKANGATGYNTSVWTDTTAQAASNFTFGTTGPWGTIAIELTRAA